MGPNPQEWTSTPRASSFAPQAAPGQTHGLPAGNIWGGGTGVEDNRVWWGENYGNYTVDGCRVEGEVVGFEGQEKVK